MRKFPRLLAVALCLAVLPLAGQGTLVVSQNKCDFDRVTEIRQMNDSLWLPIAQEIVNEGTWIAAGSAYHAWGDEWNVVLWYRASDIPSFLTGFNEMISRMNARHPTLLQSWFDWCTEHKDNIYGVGRATIAPS